MKNSSGIKRPTGHHVLVLPNKIKEKTAGGIILTPQTQNDELRDSTKGLLVDVGPTAWKEFADGSPWAQVDDYVLYAKHSSVGWKGNDGENYVLLNDQDILAVLDGS